MEANRQAWARERRARATLVAVAALCAIAVAAPVSTADALPPRPRRLSEVDWRMMEAAPAANVADLLSLCADPAIRSRERAASAIARIRDAAAREQVIAAVPALVHAGRRSLVPVLARWGDATSPPRWFSYALDADEGVRLAVAGALGDGTAEQILAFRAWASNAAEADRVTAQRLERHAINRVIASRLLEIAPDGSTWGLYTGQFDSLLALGVVAIEVAEEIVKDAATTFPNAFDQHLEGLQYLAVGLLAASTTPEAVAALRRCRRLDNVSEQVGEVAMLGLWRNGEKEPLDARIADLKRRSLTGTEPLALGRAAYLLGLIDAYDESIDLYKRMHAAQPGGGNAAYNISNLYCRMGDTTKTLEYLALAVDNGFVNARWARQDRDLEGVWDNEEFLVLLTVMEEQAENLLLPGP
jgi:tetratricopeptide (TPR) repeat protein